jgi:hypothetical protein
LYQTPAPEFATSVLMLDGEHLGHEVDAPCRHDGPQILVCTQGSVVVRAKSDEVRIERGSSAWVAADDGPIRLEAQEPPNCSALRLASKRRARRCRPRGTKAILAALAANAGIAVAKFVGFVITGSSSMLAEAVHSVADTSNQGLLLFGQRQARKEATSLHQFGYGRGRYFYSFVVALVLFSLGAIFALYEGYHKISPSARR